MNVGVRTRFTMAVAAYVAALLITGSASAQGPASVAGTVTDSTTQQGVPGAQITIVGTTFGTLTDDAGQYSLRGVPVGNLTLRVQRLGYARADRRVTVRAGDKEFTVRVRIDTPKEADYFRHGGILPYVLRSLMGGDA